MHHISPIYFFIRMKLTSYRDFCKKKKSWLNLLFLRFAILLNNSKLCDCVDRSSPIELEIKDSIETEKSASYLDLQLIDS